MTSQPPGAAEQRTLRLSVVVPVYNQASSVVRNLGVIRESVARTLSEDEFEIIVVSDGSIDRTGERLLESELPGVRVFHYERNLGKGYAIKLGAFEARGRWVGYIDADLDLDAAALPEYVAIAERDGLDFAIGSKRHPRSQVHYPKARRISSWLFQQLVRLLFRLNVRDTQVGLKVFRREVVEQVMPFLIVKRFAFDLELLAVARAFGFGRISELPVVLEYRFTGSGVRSLAVLRALVDTAAVFYRLRILRYYQRRRAIVGAFGWTRPAAELPSVVLVATSAVAAEGLDYPDLDVRRLEHDTPSARRAAVAASSAEVVAFVEAGAAPAANWVRATAPFLARREIGAVVTPQVAPARGSVRQRAAAAVSESRLGTGSLYFRFTPGNIRYVEDFPTATYVVRRGAFLAIPPETPSEQVVARICEGGSLAVYTPETVVTLAPAPLYRPYLARIFAYGGARGGAIRRQGARALRLSTVAALALAAFAVAGPVFVVAGPELARAWGLMWLAYGVAVAVVAVLASLRFRSVAVGLAAALALVLTHVAYLGGLLFGLLRRPSPRALGVRPPERAS